MRLRAVFSAAELRAFAWLLGTATVWGAAVAVVGEVVGAARRVPWVPDLLLGLVTTVLQVALTAAFVDVALRRLRAPAWVWLPISATAVPALVLWLLSMSTSGRWGFSLGELVALAGSAWVAPRVARRVLRPPAEHRWDVLFPPEDRDLLAWYLASFPVWLGIATALQLASVLAPSAIVRDVAGPAVLVVAAFAFVLVCVRVFGAPATLWVVVALDAAVRLGAAAFLLSTRPGSIPTDVLAPYTWVLGAEALAALAGAWLGAPRSARLGGERPADGEGEAE